MGSFHKRKAGVVHFKPSLQNRLCPSLSPDKFEISPPSRSPVLSQAKAMTKDCRISEPPIPLRRSARLLEANAAKIKKTQVHPNSPKKSRISSSCQQICLEISTEVVTQSANPRNGVLKSTKFINGVEGFQGRRRSPRFSTMVNTPQIVDKKTSVKRNNGVLALQGCRRTPRIAISNTNPEKAKKKCAKSNIGAKKPTRKNNLQVVSEEACVDWDDDPLKCAVFTPRIDKEVPVEGSGKRKARKRGTQSLQVMRLREIHTPKVTGMKKKTNVKCVSNEELSIVEVQEMALSQLRTPFSLIENCTPENAKETVFKKLVHSRGLSNPSVKSTRGAIKQTVRSTNSKCGIQGWTKDQEVALQTAYFAARPSPHFWKKISKLVPGKSPQECFDKIQMNSITTPQPQPRSHSRANRTNPSPLSHFSLSGSKLLESAKLNVKKSKSNKRSKTHAHKAVRHLLQKQNMVNQGFKRDLFSILESTTSSFPQVSPESKTLATPQCKLGMQGFLQDDLQRTSSSQKKPFSRFRDSCLASIVSPPVLKRVKNMAIHERYIDQLHNREAKRTAAGRRRVSASENMKENVKKLDAIKEAKDNLVSEARDMIKKFQHMQATAMDISEDIIDPDGSSTDDGECSI